MMLPLITLSDLPPEGRQFSGEIRPDLFGLPGPYDPIFVPPLKYDLTVRRDDGDVIVEGSLSARFSLQCSHCPSRLLWQIEMDPYFSCEEQEEDTLDLTAQVREDILLTLPGYPRCEESNVEPQPCQTEGAFAPESEFVPLADEAALESPRADIWKALDQLPPGGLPPSSS
jgi:hypothetical protein